MNLKAKTRQQIASEYGISVKTLSRWIKENNLDIKKGLLTPAEQKKIYDFFGIPFKDHQRNDQKKIVKSLILEVLFKALELKWGNRSIFFIQEN